MEFKLWFLGFLWGILMIAQDLNTYYVYILLLVTSVNKITCSNFLDYYTLFAFIDTIISGICYPISGWITDATAEKSGLVFLISNILQLVFIILQILPLCLSKLGIYTDFMSVNGWIIMCIFWQLAQAVSIQNENSLWKLIKQIVDTYDTSQNSYIMLYETENNKKDNIKTLQMINNIGNIGDLTSDVVETILLGILILVITAFNGDYKFILMYTCGIITILNALVCVMSIAVLKYKKNNVNIESIINREINTDRGYINPFRWIIDSIKQFYKQKVALHAYWHCIVLGIYATIVAYPLSLKEVNIINVDKNQTLDNLCGGTLTNLMIIGAITNACYLVGSICYRIFIVNATPVRFYRWYYPIGSIILLCMTSALWFNLEKILTFTLISFATIIPYYLTYYDYYLFTNECKDKSYGFILGSYGAITTVITALIQSLYFTNTPVGVIIASSIILLVISIVYSYYLVYIIKKDEKVSLEDLVFID